MQLIIPLAGRGTRLRPHTHTKPKPLVHVAGKPILGHILDLFKDLDISSAVFITGDMEDQIKNFVSENYKFKASYIKQEELLGDGHAINLAKDYITEDAIIVFVDTIFKADFKRIKEQVAKGADGIVWVSEVDDPERFGIVTLDKNNKIKSIIEKPEDPPTNLALIGLYYLKDKNKLFGALNKIITQGITSKSEYRLADALSLMIQSGDNIVAETVSVWEDCGKPETLLSTNKHLLENGCSNTPNNLKNSVIVPPVFVETGVEIENSIIGPNVSIAKGAKVINSIISNSIINTDTTIKDTVLSHSLIGSNASIKLNPIRMNIGDHSKLNEHTLIKTN